jgi:hypothetical protein
MKLRQGRNTGVEKLETLAVVAGVVTSLVEVKIAQ